MAASVVANWAYYKRYYMPAPAAVTQGGTKLWSPEQAKQIIGGYYSSPVSAAQFHRPHVRVRNIPPHEKEEVMTAAIWRTIPGHEAYEVSPEGDVRNARTGRVLKERRNPSTGAWFYTLWRADGKRTSRNYLSLVRDAYGVDA